MEYKQLNKKIISTCFEIALMQYLKHNIQEEEIIEYALYLMQPKINQIVNPTNKVHQRTIYTIIAKEKLIRMKKEIFLN